MTASIDYSRLIHEDRVHGSLYTDPAVFEDEMERLFRRGWVFVGHESEVPAAGDWITRNVGIDPMIMVRDRNGNVNVLANRCSHRGTALCFEHRGNDTSFQCTYHAWNYGLDGSLRSVPYPGGFHKDKADLALDRPGQVENYRGFIFANQSGDAGPLAAHLSSAGMTLIDRLCDLSPTGNIDVSAGWIPHQVESNWKMWYESDADGNHLQWVHGSMFEAADDSYYAETVLGGEEGNASRAIDHGLGHVEIDLRPSYLRELSWLGTTREKSPEYCDALEQARGEERARELLWEGPPHALLFPNLFLAEMNLVIIEPVSPTRIVHRHTPVMLEGMSDRFNQRLIRQSEAAVGPASFIVTDDAVTAERIQAGTVSIRANSADESSNAGWIDMSRGMKREIVADDGTRSSLLSDETTNRGFWRQYREVMCSRADRAGR